VELEGECLNGHWRRVHQVHHLTDPFHVPEQPGVCPRMNTERKQGKRREDVEKTLLGSGETIPTATDNDRFWTIKHFDLNDRKTFAQLPLFK
jgi:hypothetical protein